MIQSIQSLNHAISLRAPAPRRGRPKGSRNGARKATLRARGKFNPSKQELSALRESMTGAEIAKKFGVTLATVSLRARRLGVAEKRRGRRKAK